MSNEHGFHHNKKTECDNSLNDPPAIVFFTVDAKVLRSRRRSSAASVEKSVHKERRNRQHRTLIMITHQSNLPLLSGSSGFGSKNKYCSPTMTELRLSTGFQSSRRMLRQTLPSRSRFGW
jgi:hypothetical protein